ncbi:MAG: pentapeptide repeat-containing protein [Candidatus Coatesbacteria bacterium]
MGDPDHLAKILQGVPAWNEWREANPDIQPNLTRADLSGRDLTGVDFRGAGLFKANLHGAILVGANLRQARLVSTELDAADLSGASVYGASVWDVSLAGAIQRDLIITRPGQSRLTVDDLEVAQFIYLLLDNRRFRRVIDTLTSKVVLILGRFSPGRKGILEVLKAELRQRELLPVLFDFQGPDSRDMIETVTAVAHLARFVLADLTDPACVGDELQAFVPNVEVPVATIISDGSTPYATFSSLTKHSWLMRPETYRDEDDLLRRVLPLLLRKAEECRKNRHPR